MTGTTPAVGPSIGMLRCLNELAEGKDHRGVSLAAVVRRGWAIWNAKKGRYCLSEEGRDVLRHARDVMRLKP